MSHLPFRCATCLCLVLLASSTSHAQVTTVALSGETDPFNSEITLGYFGEVRGEINDAGSVVFFSSPRSVHRYQPGIGWRTIAQDSIQVNGNPISIHEDEIRLSVNSQGDIHMDLTDVDRFYEPTDAAAISATNEPITTYSCSSECPAALTDGPLDVWYSHGALVLRGDSGVDQTIVPSSFSAADGSVWNPGQVFAVNSNGDTIFNSQKEGSLNEEAFWLAVDGNIRLLAIDGEFSDGSSQFEIRDFDLATIADDGRYAVGVELRSGNSSIRTPLVGNARVNEPPTTIATELPSSRAAFGADAIFVHGRAQDERYASLFEATESGIERIIGPGDLPPGLDSNDPIWAIRGFLVNESTTAFTASYGDKRGLWMGNTDGEFRHIISSGDVMEVAPGDLRTTRGISWFDVANDQMAFATWFEDGSSGVFVVNAVPEPNNLPILMLVSWGLIIRGKNRMRME